MNSDTSIKQPRNPSDTSDLDFTSNSEGYSFKPYNRKVERYAKKHKITKEEAFKKIYGGR